MHAAAFAGLKSMGQYFVAAGADPASKTSVRALVLAQLAH